MSATKKNLFQRIGAAVKSAPSNWFLRGASGPGSRKGSSVSNAYNQSAWVFAALNFIAGPIKSAALEFKDAPDGEMIQNPKLSKFWTRPARGAHESINLKSLIDLTVKVRGVAGRVFWILDNSWIAGSIGTKQPIIVATDANMTPLWDGQELAGWAYKGADGTFLSLAPAQVVILKMSNPHDPDSLDGIPPWAAAKVAAESAHAASRFSKRVMDQNGDRGNYIIVKGAQPTEAQREILKAEIREKRRAAERGEYRDSVFGGDVEVITPKVEAVSGDFRSQKAMDREEIFVAYGVPPSMSTQAQNYSIGSASDKYQLITETCSAEASEIAEAISEVSEYYLGIRSLAQEVAGGIDTGRKDDRQIVACFNFDNNPVMSKVREERIETVEKLFKMGMPVEAANEFLNLGMNPFPGWENGYLPYTLAQVGKSAPAQKTSNDPAESKTAKNYDDISDLVRQRSRNLKKKSEGERIALWKKVDNSRAGSRNRLKKQFSSWVMKARKETLRNLKENKDALEKAATSGDVIIRAGALDIIFDLAGWSRGLLGAMKGILGGIFVDAAEQATDEVPGDYDPMSEADPRVIAFLRNRENFIKGTADDVHQQVLATLEEGISAGETFDELTARVRSEFNNISRVKAEIIARTETGAAYETARYLTFKDAGIEKKGWLSGGDDGVTRATHQAADGQIVGIDSLFKVGEAKLLHPHDQENGGDHPEELINCRCVLIAEE